jgi:hypothetical protein
VSSIELTSTAQLKEWILCMYSNRTTAKTKMNDASSRSRCAFILQLHQLRSDGNYIHTNFSIIDLGSERHSKMGGQRMTGTEAGLEAYRMYDAGTPELLSVGAQGTMINMELSFIATEILKAADMHKKGMPFTAAKEMSTAVSFSSPPVSMGARGWVPASRSAPLHSTASRRGLHLSMRRSSHSAVHR